MSSSRAQLVLIAVLAVAGCAGGQEMIPPLPTGSGGSSATGAGGGGGGGSGGTTSTGSGGATAGRGGATGAAGSGAITGAAGRGGTTGAAGAGGASAGRTISFTEDFESATRVAAGWIVADANGTWQLVTDGSSVYRGTDSSEETMVVGGDGSWTDQIVEVKIKVLTTGSSSWLADVLPRFAGLDDYYQLSLYESGLQLHKRQAGTRTQLGDKYKAPTPPTTGTFYTVKVQISNGAGGATITAWLNGVQALTFLDPTPIPAGGIGLGVEAATAEFDDVKVSWP